MTTIQELWEIVARVAAMDCTCECGARRHDRFCPRSCHCLECDADRLIKREKERSSCEDCQPDQNGIG
jgi:hypothetical protein